MIKFLLNGCDISFYAEAPKDMTVEQLVRQASRIKPLWCACGIRAEEFKDAEIVFDYDNVQKVSEDVSCRIMEIDESEEFWGVNLHQTEFDKDVK